MDASAARVLAHPHVPIFACERLGTLSIHTAPANQVEPAAIVPLPVTERECLRGLPWCLASQTLNSIFAIWTFGGTVFLLFLAELGLPKARIGALLSLFPFCGLLALAFAPLATRLGRKRVFLFCYGTRKFVMAALVLLPWVLDRFGLAAGMALLVAGQVLAGGSGLTRYRVLIGAGCALGLAGVALMAKVPGGAPLAGETAAGAHLANLAGALRDRNFAAYLGGLGGVTIAVYYAWLGLTSGIAPLLAGRILGAWATPRDPGASWLADGHRILFVLAGLLVAVGTWAYQGVRPDDRYRTRDVLLIAVQRVWRRAPA